MCVQVCVCVFEPLVTAFVSQASTSVADPPGEDIPDVSDSKQS